MTAAVRGELDRRLRELQEALLDLGRLVDQAIEGGMTSLKDRDVRLAREIARGDEAINERRYQIEELSIQIIATQQPAARDLREIMAAMIVANELERMGDHAEGIARVALRAAEEPLLEPLIDLPRMAEACRGMVSRALDAYLRHDVSLAREVASEDDEVDSLYKRVFHSLLTAVRDDPVAITRALYLLFVANNLERIADRATNVAERAVFVTSGEMRELNPEPDEAKLH